MASGEPRGWANTTALLEALGGAGAALWRYDVRTDRLDMLGDLRALGLQPLAPHCSRAALMAMTDDADRAGFSALLTPGGGPSQASVRLLSGVAAIWRGEWLEDGGCVTGVIIPTATATDTFDALTGLLDRSSFLRRVEQRLLEAGSIRLVAADLARLRRLNEGLGPERADLVLRVLGARLSSVVPHACAPARLGEDEFAFILEETGGEDPLPAIRDALEAPLSIRGVDIHPSLWIGAARAEGATEADAHELVRRASVALQSAKSAGKTLSVAKPPAGDGLSRLALEADLHGALARGEIVPFFQPIAHLETGQLAGFEALARWKHPRRGLIMPDDFLPLIADAGQMDALGRHILETSAAQIATWRSAHPDAGDLFVAVNLTTGEIEDERLVGFVADLVRRHHLPPRTLKIEVTESDIMRDPERAAVTLTALREAGAGISLDDFGTGFSSLAYLTRLPFETLKIDRYFVRTMGENEGSEKIVRSVASLGRDLGLEVVAEGVETVAVARRLAALGCHYGQGFGYAPALDAREAEVYLNESYLDGAPIRQTA